MEALGEILKIWTHRRFEATQATTTPDPLSRILPEGIGECLWERVKPELASAISTAVKDSAWPIYLFGEPGRGKSCAAGCVFLNWPRWAIWHETHAVVSDVLSCRTNGHGYIVKSCGDRSWDEWEGSISRKVGEASLVCFDDVGMRKPSDAAYEIFFNLVELRKGKPTIYTGNLSGKSLMEVYDKRIASRLLSGTVIEVTGEDRRKETRKVVRA